MGKYFRTSLFWMGIALPLGGSPLVVYFTQPGAPAANLVLAAALGIPPFGLSFIYLLKYRALVLRRDDRLAVFVEGVFLWRKVRASPFEDVVEVRLVRDPIGKGEGGESYRVELIVRGGDPIVLEGKSLGEASNQVRAIASAIGVRGVHGENVLCLPDPRPDALRRIP